MKKENIIVTDYSLLKIIKGNRKVSTNIKSRLQLKNDLRANGQIYPIICVPTKGGYLICDGQHRAEILKECNMPIEVRLFSNEDDSPITYAQIDWLTKKCNNTGKPWNNDVYLNWDNVFCENKYTQKFTDFRTKYKNLDINALYCIVTGDTKFRVKEQIQESTLKFEGDFDALLTNIDHCSEELIKLRRNAGLKGLRKTTINMALNHIFKDSKIDPQKVAFLLGNHENLHKIEVADWQSCASSILKLYK